MVRKKNFKVKYFVPKINIITLFRTMVQKKKKKRLKKLMNE